MRKSKYRAFFSEEIVEKSPYPAVTAPAIRYIGDRGSEVLTFDWNCVAQPLTVQHPPCAADRDQFVLFAGSEMDDFGQLGARVRLHLGTESTEHLITVPTLVYIPRGLTYGPVTFSEVETPLVWMNFFIAPQLSKRWNGGDYDVLLATPRVLSGAFHTWTTCVGEPLSEQVWPKQVMVVLGDSLGPEGANFSLFYYAITAPYYMAERTHSHLQDMWLINLGGDPLDVEDFDAEVSMWWGEEAERLVVDSVSVAHVPPGLLHRGLFYDPVRKPYVQIHVYTAPGPDKDVVFDEH
jgi:hypothetical protein